MASETVEPEYADLSQQTVQFTNDIPDSTTTANVVYANTERGDLFILHPKFMCSAVFW